MLKAFAGDISADAAGGFNGVSAGAMKKYELLKELLHGMRSVMVAFSGGVDSTFLLKAAFDELGEKAAGATATSPTYPDRELNEAKKLAVFIGARHIIFESNELLIPNFSENTEKRCYFCKSELFAMAHEKARQAGFECVADGSNADDLTDYRPGRAAAEELGVRSPLVEAGLSKGEIRELSRALGLPTWNKPAFACLSSRFPYGTEITEERLSKVQRGEDLLCALGFRQFRVRYHGDTVRIEAEPSEMNRLLDEALRRRITAGFKEIGFIYVTIDLEGYRRGSMNEALTKIKAEA